MGSNQARKDVFASAFGGFQENLPRPPVFPGGNDAAVPGNATFRGGTSHRSEPQRIPGRKYEFLTPQESSSSRGYEPAEGSANGTPPLPETPPYLRWAENLLNLLSDEDGVQLYSRYLEQEGCRDLLDFWFACQGLKKRSLEDPEEIPMLIKVIHRRYIRSHQLGGLSERVRQEIGEKVASKKGLVENIFDKAQQEVEEFMNKATYPNFLKSEVYLQYIQQMQNGPEAQRSRRDEHNHPAKLFTAPYVEESPLASFEKEKAPPAVFLPPPGASVGVVMSGTLATVHEDSELCMPLTQSAIAATERKRSSMIPGPLSGRGKLDTLGSYSHAMGLMGARMGMPPPVNPYSYAYSSYNPVSRQDSELQSLSSDAQTDDTHSLTDTSVDNMSIGYPVRPTKKQQRRMHRQVKENAAQNRDAAMHQMVIPRTQRITKEMVPPQEAQKFFALLLPKLENVKRQQEAEEKLEKKLQAHDEDTCPGDECIHPHRNSGNINKTLVDALQRLGVASESDTQAILDEHVQRIWSDQTPLRSPGGLSPRPWSPEARRRTVPAGVPFYPSAYAGKSHIHHRRKDKDANSTFSADSGAVLDYYEVGIGKNKGYGDGQPFGNPTGGNCRGKELPRKSGVPKRLPVPEPDSGVSVISDAPPTAYPNPPLPVSSKERVFNWILENDKYQGVGQEGDRDGNNASKHRVRTGTNTSPGSSRRSRKQAQAATHTSSRSTSQERAWPSGGAPMGHSLHSGSGGADGTAMSDDGKAKLKPKPGSAVRGTVAQDGASMLPPAGPISNPSTLRKHRPGSSKSGEGASTAGASVGAGATASAGGESTVVMFTIGDETVPYRTKIPGPGITLKQFKENLPNKKKFKYYFKMQCEDDPTIPVYQEIMDDSEILPLWEGKVLGSVKPCD